MCACFADDHAFGFESLDAVRILVFGIGNAKVGAWY
jgi:hypothetical protein